MYGKGAVGHIVEFMDKSMEFKESHPSAAEWSGCIWGAAGAQGAYNIGMSDQLEYDHVEDSTGSRAPITNNESPKSPSMTGSRRHDNEPHAQNSPRPENKALDLAEHFLRLGA